MNKQRESQLHQAVEKAQREGRNMLDHPQLVWSNQLTWAAIHATAKRKEQIELAQLTEQQDMELGISTETLARLARRAS